MSISTGFVVPDGDAKAMANRIRLLLANCDLSHQMGRQANRWAQRGSWPAIAKIVEVFEQTQPAAEATAQAYCGSLCFQWLTPQRLGHPAREIDLKEITNEKEKN